MNATELREQHLASDQHYGGATANVCVAPEFHCLLDRIEELEKAMFGCAHAHVVPDAGDGHPGILVQKRHSDFVACPVCDALYEWGTSGERKNKDSKGHE